MPINNVLFVSIEDLNDFVEPLGGHPLVVTPNISRLAATGTLFSQAYAVAPACAPSRAAVLFGQAPWMTGLYTNKHRWYSRFAPGARQSLVGHFKDADFRTFGAGKMFYGGYDPADWDVYFEEPLDEIDPISPLKREAMFRTAMIDYGPAPIDGPLYDDRNADNIISTFAPGATNTFWSLGIYRPHLPFIAPPEYFDLYPGSVGAPPGVPNGIYDPDDESQLADLPAEPVRRLIQGTNMGKVLSRTQQYGNFLCAYLASVSYADAVLGRVLAALDESGIRDNTVVVLWSDHGYQFGERLAFHKFTLWDRALHIPMIFSGPEIARQVSGEPVSNLDIMPTLLGLFGLTAKSRLDGQDLSQLLRGSRSATRGYAPSVYGVSRRDGDHLMASSVRDSRYRLTRYWRGGLELFDHDTDPYEQKNLVSGLDLRSLTGERGRAAQGLEKYLIADFAPSAPHKGLAGENVTKSRSGRDGLPHWAKAVYSTDEKVGINGNA